jgi:hypothetical protein
MNTINSFAMRLQTAKLQLQMKKAELKFVSDYNESLKQQQIQEKKRQEAKAKKAPTELDLVA